MTDRSVESSAALRLAIFAACAGALVRLVPLQWLHPLNWDELEFYRATRWIAEGRIPFRDFWEHHTPLAWFLFAPFSRLTGSPGVDAILAMRWAQIPVWIATFWLLNLWMRDAGTERFARWAAMAIALCSSLFMIPAVEYRVESLACLLFVLGLVLVQRNLDLAAGIVFCLAGLTNLRFGPVLVVAVLLLLRWRIVAGGLAALAAALGAFAAVGALDEMWQQVWLDNLGEKFATPVIGAFVHRLLVPFGVRILASDRLFEWAAVDVGGIAVLLLGFAGLLLVLIRRPAAGVSRRQDAFFFVAILQLANLLFIATMKFIYNYHFALTVILAVPLMAWMLHRLGRRTVVAGLLVVALGVSAFAALLRGKEQDLAYQDRIMREVHARTAPGDAVWSGVPWALRREPAYRFWFLPELARQLVLRDLAPRYAMTDPPAAVVFDHYALVWVATVQRELASQLVRHYIPVWRNLWVPGMNAVVRPGTGFGWIVPRDGLYRLSAATALVQHPWFRDPLGAASYKEPDAARLTIELPEGGAGELAITVDDMLLVPKGERLSLRKGQRVTAFNTGRTEVAVILLSTEDRILFRQPPPGASLEAETTRVTHVPDFGARRR